MVAVTFQTTLEVDLPAAFARFAQIAANGVTNAFYGLDFRIGLGTESHSGIFDEGTSQPFFDVPAGETFATDFSVQAQAYETDVISIVQLQATVWKLGALAPT